jgi:hypothetical protein
VTFSDSAGVVVDEPLAFPDNAILTLEQVAAWLQLHPKTASRLPIKYKLTGDRSRRYLGKWVREYMEAEEGSDDAT